MSSMKKSLGAKTLVYPTPVFVVGTYDKEGKPNVMTASWGGICCSQPPCVAVSLRKATYTHGNILARKAFTISIPSEDHVQQADYFGLVSGRSGDKLAATKLTPVRSELVDAPYVKEFSSDRGMQAGPRHRAWTAHAVRRRGHGRESRRERDGKGQLA